jgi:hypothetical protein
VLVKVFQKDRIDNQAVFKEGTQLETEGLVTLSAKKFAVALAFKDVVKAGNKTFSTGGSAIINAAKDNASGNIFWSTGQVTYNVSERFSFTSSLGMSVFGKSEMQLGEAQLFSLGGGLHFKSSEHLLFNTAFSFSSGDAKDLQGRAVELQGFLVTGGLSLRY